MTYRLSKRSWDELEKVHPKLVQIVERAIIITPVDFGVWDGIRTKEEQREYVAQGVSWTMNSKHLPQEDGWGLAVDLVPYINGKFRWEWEPLYKVADTMRSVARDFGAELRWGGHWGSLTDNNEMPEHLVSDYVALRRSQGRRAVPDGPHYELLV